MFITPAFAQAATPAPGVSDMLIQIMPFILIMGIMIIALGFGNATIVSDVIKLGLPGVFLR